MALVTTIVQMRCGAAAQQTAWGINEIDGVMRSYLLGADRDGFGEKLQSMG